MPPDLDNIKLNYDASFNTSRNTFTSSTLTRNEFGEIMAACTYSHHGIANAFIAKARACEQAVVFAQDLGLRLIQVEGDSFISR